MSGINTLSGLNNVNVDFRPTVDLTAPKINEVGQPPQDVQNDVNANNVVNEDKAPHIEKAEAKSVVRQLDVLLLGAAGKSVSTKDAKDKVNTIGAKLVKMGVLSKNQASRLNDLAKDAAAKLKKLDNFSGMDLARALVRKEDVDVDDWSSVTKQEATKKETIPGTTKKDVIEWGKSIVATAVTAAIEAQMKLSEALSEFNDALASDAQVDADLQEQFMELQFQCDRRASEIDSIVFRMFDLAQKDVVAGDVEDMQITALLGAKFKELLPREAIMMHGTAEAFESMNKTFGEGIQKLTAKLDAFAADGNKIL